MDYLNYAYAVIHNFVIFHPLATIGIIVVLAFLILRRPKNISTWIIGIVAVIAVYSLYNMYQGSLYTDSGDKKDFINLPKLETSDD